MPLKERVRQGGEITPVHWHIGTMVTENIRRSDTLRNDGFTYKQRYTRYLESMSSPKSLYATSRFSTKDELEDMTSNHSAMDYYKIRGMIARDDLLFSDDRENLLKLCESKIKGVTGGSMTQAQNSIPSSTLAITENYSKEPRSGPNPSEFKWQTYGDALGVWGRLITNGGNSNIAIGELGSGDMLDVQGVGMKSNQIFSTNGIFELGAKDQPNEGFFKGLANVIEFITPYILGNGAILSALPKPSVNGSQFGPTASITPQEYLLNAKDLTYRWLDKESGLGLDDGYMACFKLRHAFDASQDNFKDIRGDDDLRLWLRLRVVNGTQSDKKATFALYVGITSSIMKPMRKDADGVAVEWSILEFNDDETYNPARYFNPAIWSEFEFADCGNLTADDVRFFSENLINALHS